MLPTHRPPTPPGAMLLQEYLKPRGITQVDLAARMGVPVQRVNTLINGKRGVTAETAILLSEALDTTPQFWMALQSDHDLWAALQRRRGGGSRSPVRAAPSAHRTASGRSR